MLDSDLSLIRYVLAGDDDAGTLMDDRSEHGAHTDAAMPAPGGKMCTSVLLDLCDAPYLRRVALFTCSTYQDAPAHC